MMQKSTAFKQKKTGLKIVKPEERAYLEPTPLTDSDIAGAIWASSGIKDSLTLEHGPMGCIHFLHYLRSIETHDAVQLATTGLAEREVIFGGEEQLRNAIEKGVKVYSPSIICVVGTTVSALIGDDVDGIINVMQREWAEKDVQIPIISVPTSHLEGNMMTGFNQVVEALVDKVVEEPTQSLPRTVNIFGVLSITPNASADVLEIKRLLGKLGIEVNEVFCCDAEIDRIKRASEASLNLVVSEVMGVEAAKKMEQRFGLPYRVVPYPIGLSNTRHFLQVAADFFEIETAKLDELIATETKKVNGAMRKALFWHSNLGRYLLPGATAAIIGDSTHVLAVTRFLMEEWQVKPLLIVLQSYEQASLESLNQMAEEIGLAAQVLLKPTRLQICQGLVETNPQLVLGGCYDRLAMRRVGIDQTGTVFIQIGTFPSSTNAGRIDVFPHPFAGFMGVIYLSELIVNELAKARFERHSFRIPVEGIRHCEKQG